MFTQVWTVCRLAMQHWIAEILNVVWFRLVPPQDVNNTWVVMLKALTLHSLGSLMYGHLGTVLSRTQFSRGCHGLNCCQNITKMPHTAYARGSLFPNIIWSPSACAFLLNWNEGRSASAKLNGTQRQDLTWNDPRWGKSGESYACVCVCTVSVGCVVWANSVRSYETLDAEKLQHGAANKRWKATHQQNGHK